MKLTMGLSKAAVALFGAALIVTSLPSFAFDVGGERSEVLEGESFPNVVDRCTLAGLWAYQYGGLAYFSVEGSTFHGEIASSAPVLGQRITTIYEGVVQSDRVAVKGTWRSINAPVNGSGGLTIELSEDGQQYLAHHAYVFTTSTYGTKIAPGECK